MGSKKPKIDNSFFWVMPQKFRANNELDVSRLKTLMRRCKPKVHDGLQLIINELYDLRYPEQKDSRDEENFKKFVNSYDKNYGNWFYFSWKNLLVRYPLKNDLRNLRTSRNRNLITNEEQKKLYDSTILIAGLSVGSNVIESLLNQGIGSHLIISDMDIIEPSNLNRIRAKFCEVGVSKVDYVAKMISEIDPYIKQTHLMEGIKQTNLKNLISEHKPDVIVDELDDIRVKVCLRRVAKQASTPILMGTDNGDNIILDVERYDLDQNTEIFSGLIPPEVIKRIESGIFLERNELGRMIGEYFVGFDNVSIRMLNSITAVGKSLPSWPQLGGSAAMCGIYIAYAIRKILLDEEIIRGRIHAGPEIDLDLYTKSSEYHAEKNEIIRRIRSL